MKGLTHRIASKNERNLEKGISYSRKETRTRGISANLRGESRREIDRVCLVQSGPVCDPVTGRKKPGCAPTWRNLWRRKRTRTYGRVRPVKSIRSSRAIHQLRENYHCSSHNPEPQSALVKSRNRRSSLPWRHVTGIFSAKKIIHPRRFVMQAGIFAVIAYTGFDYVDRPWMSFNLEPRRLIRSLMLRFSQLASRVSSIKKPDMKKLRLRSLLSLSLLSHFSIFFS